MRILVIFSRLVYTMKERSFVISIPTHGTVHVSTNSSIFKVGIFTCVENGVKWNANFDAFIIILFIFMFPYVLVSKQIKIAHHPSDVHPQLQHASIRRET